MKYMLLMYGAEGRWTDEEREACMVESMGICDELAAQGKFVAAVAARVGDDRRDRPRARRQDARHRRPVRRDDRAARRLLHPRPRPPRRGDRRRLASFRPSRRAPSRSARSIRSTVCRRRGRSRPTAGGGRAARYMLLCYDDEAAWRAAGPDALQEAMAEAVALARELSDAGRYVSASPLHSVGDGDVRAGAGREARRSPTARSPRRTRCWAATT